MEQPAIPKYRNRKWHRWITLIWSYLECIGFSGLVYGWSSLVYVLKNEEFYVHLCHDNTGSYWSNVPNGSVLSNQTLWPPLTTWKSCMAQDEQLYLVFTIAVSALGAGVFVGCAVSFRFGIRGTRLYAFVIYTSGSLCIAIASKEHPWPIFPGMSLLAIGGTTMLATNVQVSFLFPVWGSMVVGMMTGAFDSSAVIQLFVKVGYENGISRTTAYVVIACTHVLTLVNTFFLLPKDHYEKVEALEIEKSTFQAKEDEGDGLHSTDVAINRNSLLQDCTGDEFDRHLAVDIRHSSLTKCLLSSEFILHAVWMVCLQLRFNFYISSFNVVLENMFETKHEVSEYTNIMMYVLLCGGVASPCAGCVFDLLVKLFKNKRSPFSQQLLPCVGSLSMASLFGILLSLSTLFTRPATLSLELILLVLTRAVLYTNVSAFLKRVFPSQYFTTMLGLLTFLVGILSLPQYAIFIWAEKHSFQQVNIFFLFFTMASLIHPAYLWWRCSKVNCVVEQQPEIKDGIN